MQEAYWNGLFDTRWEDSPLGREAIRLILWLRERGHGERSRREYAHAVVHMGRVLQEAHGDVTARKLNETIVDEFIGQHLPGCCCYRRRPGRRAVRVRRGLTHLLAMLRQEGTIPQPVSAEPLIYHEVLDGYCRFLRDDRGLAETTIINYRRYVRDFLISRGGAVSPGELAQVTEDDLLAFGRERGVALGATAWNHVALSLSSFWRWMDLRGHGTRHLIGCGATATAIPACESAMCLGLGPGATTARGRGGLLRNLVVQRANRSRATKGPEDELWFHSIGAAEFLRIWLPSIRR